MEGLNELALFSGAGGGILGGKLLGWSTVCAVELDPYARRVLLSRQRDGALNRFPIWDDARTFDGAPWRGSVDIITAGWPCTDISAAGQGAGIRGEQSGLWSEVARLVSEIRPRYAFLENSPLLTRRGLDCVLSDLAEIRYDAVWAVIGASELGAPHKRERIWILCTPQRDLYNSDCTQRKGNKRSQRVGETHTHTSCADWWEDQPPINRVANGVAHQLDRLRCIGNGQVPAVARHAFLQLFRETERGRTW